MIQHWRIWITSGTTLLSLVCSGAASAQIAGDGSLGTMVNGSLVVPCASGTCLITGGTRANNFLFHSFGQFSIPSGSDALFDAAGVRAIFARVTGGEASVIAGRLTAGSDLFLLNPQGVLFGPNATLNLGGSLVVSTADSIVFDNGAQFRADRTFDPPLLTISVPIGLQFGANPAPITVQGTGNGLFLNPNNLAIERSQTPGLAVAPSATLALMAGPIRLAGGTLSAPQGRLELGSVGPGSQVTLTPNQPGWRFDYAEGTQFQDIDLTQAAAIDVSGNGGGAIQVQGRQVTLSGGSVLLSDTLGDGAGQSVAVRAETLTLSGIAAAPLYTGIFADAASTATRRGGDIRLQVGQLTLTEGAQIGVNTFGAGDAGTLTVQAQTIALVGGSFLGPSSLFASVAPGATGAGGSVTITTDRLQVTQGGQVSTTSFGSGATGALTVQAREISLSGVFSDPDLGEKPANLSTDMLENAIGQGGNLSIVTQSLQVSGGAQISSGTFGAGNAGAITVQAQDIDLRGGSTTFVSGILAPVALAATGRGGAINLQIDRLNVSAGAQIATTTFGLGDAGNLTIAADSVRLTGQADPGRSGLFAAAVGGSGAGGDLTVITDRLIVQDGATISVSNFPSTTNSPFAPGQGAAGDLAIAAHTIQLERATLTANTVTGDRGNINLQTDRLTLRNGSQISTNAQATAAGGNIRIAAPNGFILAVPAEDSNITANAVQGNGGRVEITAKGIYGIAAQPRLTAQSDITASSEFGPAGIVTLNTPTDRIQPRLAIANQLAPALLQGCQTAAGPDVSRFTNTGRGGTQPQPTELLDSQTILGDVTLPQSWRAAPVPSTSRPATAPVSAPANAAPSAPLVEAKGWIVNEHGVTLVAKLPPLAPPETCPQQYYFQQTWKPHPPHRGVSSHD